MLHLRSCNDFPGAFDADGAAQYLSEAEMTLFGALKVPKRQREWLLGRLTVKDAARQLWAGRFDVRIDWADISVLPDEDKAPTIQVAGPHQFEAPSLTCNLSHRGEFVLATVEEQIEGRSIGVDIELVEPRLDAFIRDYFNAREQSAMMCAEPLELDRQVTTFWCLKEAILKAVKKGLSVSADKVEIVGVAADGSVIAQCDTELTNGHVTARCWHLPRYVMAWAAVEERAETREAPQAPHPARVWTPQSDKSKPLLKVVG